MTECGTDAGKLTSSYEYVDGGYGTNSTTPLVKKITQNGISFEYEYDSRGNIVSEKRGNLTTTYAYDALGQLIRVNDPHENATWVYSYDRGGNILSKVKYAYTTGTVGTVLETIPYTYGDANWKDKLTAYNGTAITYDAIGNPLNDGAWTFTWAAGRQLKKMVREDRTLDFKYDHNGMRIQKVLQHDWYPETTNYTYHGKLLTHMTVDYYDWDEVAQQDKLHFFYDGTGCLTQLSFKNSVYTYVQDSQGDIVGILDSAGVLVVEYKYDAWGRLLNTTGSLADTLGKRNPFRYRGYVYDEESELYYLHTRYYAPLQGRFISPDQMEVTDSEIFSENRYAYCKNNPCVQRDSEGTLGLFAIGAIVGAVAGFVGQVVSDVVTSVINQEVTVSSWQTYVGATVGGAASGVAFVATGGNPAVATKVSSAVSGGVTTLTSGVLEKLTNDDYDQTWGEIMANTALDTAVGFAVSYIDIRISGITSGRNSMSAVYKSGLTKLRNGTAQNMSRKVVAKGVASMATASLAMDAYYGVKQAAYSPLKALLKGKDRSIGNLRGPRVYSVIK